MYVCVTNTNFFVYMLFDAVVAAALCKPSIITAPDVVTSINEAHYGRNCFSCVLCTFLLIHKSVVLYFLDIYTQYHLLARVFCISAVNV